jgi:hypothetical protein
MGSIDLLSQTGPFGPSRRPEWRGEFPGFRLFLLTDVPFSEFDGPCLLEAGKEGVSSSSGFLLDDGDTAPGPKLQDMDKVLHRTPAGRITWPSSHAPRGCAC